MEKTMENKIEIYKSADGMTEVAVRFEAETVWLNQYQLAELFDTDRTSILKHLKNIYESGELDEQATCAKIAQVRQEGRRKVTRQIFHYDLDAIISVGYRVNSLRGTQFRQWATKRLKDYLVQGYAVNEKRLAQKQQEVRRLKDGIRILSRAIEDKAADTDFQWLNLYAAGLRLLDDYDHETLDSKGETAAPVAYPAYEDYMAMNGCGLILIPRFSVKSAGMGLKAPLSRSARGLATWNCIPPLRKSRCPDLFNRQKSCLC